MDVVATVQSCGASHQGLATASQLRKAGLAPGAIARAVAAAHIRRIHRRVYSVGPLPSWARFVVTDDGVAPAYVAHVRAAQLSLGAGALAHRRTAAALYGWAMLVEPTRTVELAVPHGSRRAKVRHVKVSERRGLEGRDVMPLVGASGLLATTPVQTVIDCSLTLPLMEAVVVCDSAVRARDVTTGELRRAARALPGVKDAERIRRVLDLCDPDSGSVLETVLRVCMVLDGVEGFATQHVLRDSGGGHVLRADFVFAQARLVVEVDGQKWHQDVERDRTRDNQLAAMGWRVLRYRWSEVVHAPATVLLQIRAALELRTDDCRSEPNALAPAA